MFQKYADLMVEKRRIEAELENLNPLIKEQIIASGNDKIVSEFGSFTVGKRAVWKYSDAVTELQEKEKATGVATKSETTSLTYKAPKIGGEEAGE